MDGHLQGVVPLKTSRIAVALSAFLLLAIGAHADADPALVAAAQKEGAVTWYSTLIVNQIVRPMVEAFEKKYPGIKVQYSRASSSDVALKIRNEARARRVQADLFDGSNTVFMLEEANVVADYHPKSAASYPAELKDPKGHWTALNLFYWTSAYNTNLVKDDEAPKTYGDLLDPKWKGKIAWTYDLTPGGPPGFVHNILTTMGQEKGMDYLRKFAAQEPVTIPAAQRVVLDKVVSGEYPLAVMILNYHATISMNQGAPIRWIRMEPLLQSMSLVSIVKDSPHPSAARLFVEFMLSDEGQKIMADNDYLPASPSVPAKVPENKPEAGHFKVNVVTPDMARDDAPKWTAIYKEVFR
jgi:ABC-type Fe3+ transport system substrate-binding protein